LNYMKNKAAKIILCILIMVFCFSALKNLAYPLLWNDEAETAMYAKRITEVGYPKVHNGKQTIYIVDRPDSQIAINKRFDAYLNSGWVQYYFAAPFVKIAENFKDIYTKTAILRLPFSILGIIGVLLFGLAITQALKTKREKYYFYLAYIVLAIFSVSLVLHLREVRYYSIALFLSAVLFYGFIRFQVLKNGKRWLYNIILVFTLFLLLNTFYPVFIIYLAALSLYALFSYWKNRKSDVTAGSQLLRDFWPIILSLVISIPFFIFFRPFQIIKHFRDIEAFTLADYFTNLGTMVIDFTKNQFFILAIALKTLTYLLLPNIKSKIANESLKQKIYLSSISSAFFLIYALLIANSAVFFQRYYLILYPLLFVIIILDIFSLKSFLTKKYIDNFTPKISKFFFSTIGVVSIGIVSFQLPLILNHVYELFHQYKGPLDFAIPYIQNTYKNPADLKIATNYEEHGFMYYLNSQILIGQVLNTINQDLELRPDIIFQRKEHFKEADQFFQYYLGQAAYKKVKFSIIDYDVNNIPDTNDLAFYHQFKTNYSADPQKQLEIFVLEP